MELTVEHVSKTYGKTKAVSDVSFTLEKGVYGLLGQNGAGKSTLMNMLTLQIPPDEGRILWDGEDIRKLGSRYLGLLGYMPQQQSMYPNYTVEEFLAYMAALHGLRREQTAARMKELLEILDLEEKRGQKIRALSGGMKQRLLLMQALLHHPRILILDEPTAGLDPGQRIQVRNLIMELAVDCTVLLATHVVQDVELIAKRILLMKQGKLIVDGSYRELCHMLKGKVYEMCIPRTELKRYAERFCVSSVREDLQGNYRIRFLSEQRLLREDACPVEADLEDVSLFFLGQEVKRR